MVPPLYCLTCDGQIKINLGVTGLNCVSTNAVGLLCFAFFFQQLETHDFEITTNIFFVLYEQAKENFLKFPRS
jgi:hypothetical protein